MVARDRIELPTRGSSLASVEFEYLFSISPTGMLFYRSAKPCATRSREHTASQIQDSGGFSFVSFDDLFFFAMASRSLSEYSARSESVGE